MPHTFWKGYLKLSLVTCAVELVPATSENEKMRFHTLNDKTGNRVLKRYVDAASGKPVRDQDIAKGFPRSEDEYVVIEEEELELAAIESVKAIDIEKFIPAGDVGWIWYDQPYYLRPSDKVGEEAFAVIRAAMEASNVCGLARLVIQRRERAVLLVPRGRGIVIWTLRYGDEVRDSKAYFGDTEDVKSSGELLNLMERLIKQHTENWDISLLRDPVQQNLKSMIAAKRKRRKTKPQPDQHPPAGENNVIDIMGALRKSLRRGSQS